MAAQLDALDADILIALETENCYTLQRVRAQMKTGSQYKVFFVQGKDSSTGQDVLMMTRIDPDGPVTRTDNRAHYPVAGTKCGWKDEGDSGLSKNLEARFTVPGLPPIYFLAVHLVARPTDPERCAQREAQALVMRDLIRLRAGATSDTGIIVVGDFNDWDDTIVDADDSKPISHVMSIVKSATTPPLVATSSFAAQADRWTHCSTYCNKPVCSLIDHILVNNKLLGYAADIAYELRNRTKQCVADKPVGSSDHWPVIITLYACAPGDAGCACAEGDKCNAGLACSSEGCVHADSCSDMVPQSSKCPCVAPGKKRAVEQAAAKLVLTGAIDGPLTGGLPKVIEMFAIEGGSLSSYGLGVGVNGGGSSGSQYSLPSDGCDRQGGPVPVRGGQGWRVRDSQLPRPRRRLCRLDQLVQRRRRNSAVQRWRRVRLARRRHVLGRDAVVFV
jgi:hypothetical protein